MKFVHLKTQSEYSITQGLNRLDDMIDKAKKNKAIAQKILGM